MKIQFAYQRPGEILVEHWGNVKLKYSEISTKIAYLRCTESKMFYSI